MVPPGVPGARPSRSGALAPLRPATAGAPEIGRRPRPVRSTPDAGTRCRGTAMRRGAPLTPGCPRPPPFPARAGRRVRGPGAPAGTPAVAGRPLRPPPAAAGDLRGTRRAAPPCTAAGAPRGRDAGRDTRGGGELAGREGGLTRLGGALRAGARCRTGGATALGGAAARPPLPPRARARWGSPNATSGKPTVAAAITIVASTIARCMFNSLRGPVLS